MESVIVALLTVGVISILAMCWIVRREYMLVRGEIENALHDLFAPDGSGQSPAQTFVAGVGAAVAQDIKTSLSAAMMGHASAVGKQMDAMARDVGMEQAMTENPMLALLSQSPALQRRLSKNPWAAIALQFLSSKLPATGLPAGKGLTAGGGNGHSSLNVP